MTGPEVQLITEAYLQRQIGLAVAGKVATVLFDIVSGRDRGGGYHVGKIEAPDWTSDGKIDIYSRERVNVDQHGGYPVKMTFTFKDPIYDPGVGHVDVGPGKLLADGTVNTGEYTLIQNHGVTAEKHNISKSVTETDKSEITSNESFETTAGESVEVGGDFGKFGTTLEEKFGLQKGDLEGHETSTTDTLEDEIDVPPETDYAIVFKDHKSVIQAPVDINAFLDFATMKLYFPHFFYGSSPNAEFLFAHQNQKIDDNTITFKSVDDFIRFAYGYDTRFPQMSRYPPHMSGYAKAAMRHLKDLELRRLQIKATRRGETAKDTSFEIDAVTGWDEGKVREAYGESQNPPPVDGALALAPRLQPKFVEFHEKVGDLLLTHRRLADKTFTPATTDEPRPDLDFIATETAYLIHALERAGVEAAEDVASKIIAAKIGAEG